MRPLRGLLAAALLLAAVQPAVGEEVDYDSLNEATKDAIKSACHGWIYLEAANWIAEWFDAVSPLCDAEEQARLRALQPPAPEPARKVPPVWNGGAPSDFRGGDPWALVRIECDNEYMCVKQRIRAIEAGRTVSMDEYKRIAARCQGDYWCIEETFDKLPDLEIPPPALQQSGAAETPAHGAAPTTSPAAQSKGTIVAGAQEWTPAAGLEVGKPLSTRGAESTAAPDARSLFTADAAISGVAPENLEVRVTYRNLAPVALRLGPVLFDTACADDSGAQAWGGGTAWVMPGEAVTLVTGADSMHGRSCPGGLASARPAGPVRHLQKGISGYEEQSARCSATETVPLVFVMQRPEDGRRYLFLTGDGRRIAVEAARYDANRVLGDICGGDMPLSASLGSRDHVATKERYLSRDYRSFMNAWATQCAHPNVDCAAAYRAWTAAKS